MRDTEFPVRWPGGYEALLGLSAPRKITKVELNCAGGRVDVSIADRSGFKWSCPECQEKVSIYDHSEEHACLAGRQVWPHLNTCQFGTYIHRRLPPMLNAPSMGLGKCWPRKRSLTDDSPCLLRTG